MKTDIYGQIILSETDLCNLFLRNPNKEISGALTETEINFDDMLPLTYQPKLSKYQDPKVSVNEFDSLHQNVWFLPEEYNNIDIAKIVLDKCNTDEELQRAGQELILFQERNMFPLLKYLKYLVDTMRKNNIVWGVGRGSSVASFVLFLLEVHRINSLHYDLSIDEFLK